MAGERTATWRRLLLVFGGRIPGVGRGAEGGSRVHGRTSRQSHLPAGLQRDYGTCGSGPGDLRRRAPSPTRTSWKFFSPFTIPRPGTGKAATRAAVSVRDLLWRRLAAGRGRSGRLPADAERAYASPIVTECGRRPRFTRLRTIIGATSPTTRSRVMRLRDIAQGAKVPSEVRRAAAGVFGGIRPDIDLRASGGYNAIEIDLYGSLARRLPLRAAGRRIETGDVQRHERAVSARVSGWPGDVSVSRSKCEQGAAQRGYGLGAVPFDMTKGADGAWTVTIPPPCPDFITIGSWWTVAGQRPVE